MARKYSRKAQESVRQAAEQTKAWEAQVGKGGQES
jgi:hypothetical protein